MALEKSALRHKACLRLRTHILALQFLSDVWAELDTSIHMAQNLAGERCCTFNSLLRYLNPLKDCGLAAKYCQYSALAEAIINLHLHGQCAPHKVCAKRTLCPADALVITLHLPKPLSCVYIRPWKWSDCHASTRHAGA